MATSVASGIMCSSARPEGIASERPPHDKACRASAGGLPCRSGRGSRLRFRDGQGPRAPRLPDCGGRPSAPPGDPGRPALARASRHDRTSEPPPGAGPRAAGAWRLRAPGRAPDAHPASQPRGSPVPAFSLRHPHRRAVQCRQRLLARRRGVGGVRAPVPEDQGGACRFCPRRCAPTSSPALRCPTARRSRPGC